MLHELKTPLTVLSGRVQLWQRRARLNGGVYAPTAAELETLGSGLVRLEEAVGAVEAGAHEGRERYWAIVEQAVDYAIFTTDAGGRIDTWPSGAQAVFGWAEDEAVGQSFAMTYTPEDRAAGVPEQELGRARDEGSAPNVRWHARRDGEQVFIDGAARARLGVDGVFQGLLKIGQDTTERRLVERRWREEEERGRAELEARVAAATAEVRDLSRRLLLSHEEERRRLALELHDEVGQALTGLGLQLGGGTEVGGERLETVRATFAELTEQVRELSLDLRPAALDAYGLLPALRWHLARYEQRTGIGVDLFAEGVEGRFAPEVEIAAYRIAQEALTNAARRAGQRAGRDAGAGGAARGDAGGGRRAGRGGHRHRRAPARPRLGRPPERRVPPLRAPRRRHAEGITKLPAWATG